MYDLMLLAYQANVTKVVTYMLAREISNRNAPPVPRPAPAVPATPTK
jgi:hypothetical protein